MARLHPRWLLLSVVLAFGSAHAADVRLGVGADYAFQGTGIFSGLVQVNAPLVRHLSVGGRFGVMYLTAPSQVGVPVDLSIRGEFSQLYVEGLAGPWIVFADNPVRAHVAFGFGFQGEVVSLGAEVGYFDHGGILGVRVGFRL